jgi:hypothetical protein
VNPAGKLRPPHSGEEMRDLTNKTGAKQMDRSQNYFSTSNPNLNLSPQ